MTGTWEVYEKDTFCTYNNTRIRADLYACPYCGVEHYVQAGQKERCPVCWHCGNLIEVAPSDNADKKTDEKVNEKIDVKEPDPVEAPTKSVAALSLMDESLLRKPHLTPERLAEIERDTDEEVARVLARENQKGGGKA